MWFFGWKGPPGFSASSTAEEVTQGIDGTGLTAIVTGASSGIGAETTRVLALRSVHVIMAVRNLDAGREVKEAILKEITTAQIDVMELDLSSMASVRKFASEYTTLGLPLNILINNAGVLSSPSKLSQDNIEMLFATNHIGHFLLTNLLLEIMKNTVQRSKQEGRIINVSSVGHRIVNREGICFDKIYDEASWFSYGQSKLANILHANELARRLKQEGESITANSLHPGAIHTNLLRHQGFVNGSFAYFTEHWKRLSELVSVVYSLITTEHLDTVEHLAIISLIYSFLLFRIARNFLVVLIFFPFIGLDAAILYLFGKYLIKNVQQGAATTCYIALHPRVKGISGKYFTDSNIAEPSSQAKDPELAKKLWDFSLSITNK